MIDLYSKVQEAVDHIFPLAGLPPSVGVILGVGAGWVCGAGGSGGDSVCGDSPFSAVDGGGAFRSVGVGDDWRCAGSGDAGAGACV